MTLFRNNTHRDIWQMRWCHTCFQPDEAARRLHGKNTACPIWLKALREDRKPPQWDRMPRADEMERTIKCNAHQPEPPVIRRGKAETADVPMFNIDEPDEPVRYVAVDGWPDKPTKDGVNHA
jgi:hypothetical protein